VLLYLEDRVAVDEMEACRLLPPELVAVRPD
jgi:hypothetical protein